MLGIERMPKDPEARAARMAEIKGEWRKRNEERHEAMGASRESFEQARREFRGISDLLKSSFNGVRFEGDRIIHENHDTYPLAGARASVETAGQINSRISVTRMATLGVFSLAAPKRKDRRELYLHVETTNGEFVVSVDPRKGKKAREFAAKLNTAAQNQAHDAVAVETEAHRMVGADE